MSLPPCAFCARGDCHHCRPDVTPCACAKAGHPDPYPPEPRPEDEARIADFEAGAYDPEPTESDDFDLFVEAYRIPWASVVIREHA